MKKTLLLFLFLFLTNFSIYAQYTLIPDINFEKKLIASGIDSGVTDGRVLTSKISKLTVLDVHNSSITDLTGIQDFVSLVTLSCGENNITTLDITKLTALTSLSVSSSKLTTIDLSKNTNLNSLDLQKSELVSLDVTSNTALKTFYFGANKITSIDISKNVLLTDVYSSYCPITSLDVTSNTALKSLICSNPTLTVLDLSKNKELLNLDCSGSGIKSIDISYCPKLTAFKCNDVSSLTSLNLKNGNNVNFTVFDIRRNYGLSCVQVDDPIYSNRYWLSLKEATSVFSTNCYGYTAIPDSNFENKLIADGIDKDGKNGKVLTFSISRVGSLSIASSSIADLTGIEDFADLQVLYCSSNQLTNLDVSKNLKLFNIDASSNKLTNLNVTNNIALTDLKVDSNLLTGLDTSKNLALVNFSSASNKITQLDFSLNSSLKSLNCSNNSLTGLNLKNNNNSILKTIDLRTNPSLSCILVDNKSYSDTNWATKKDASASFNHSTCDLYTLIPDVKFETKLIALGIDSGSIDGKVLTANISTITTLDVSASSISDLKGIENFTSLKTLICFENSISILDLSQNYDLTYLDCDKNDLIFLNLSKNTLLTDLICSNNNLTSIDVSQNINVINFNCASNQLLNINVSKNTKLLSFNFNGNQLKTLDISKNTVLKTLDCGGNQFAVLDFSKTTTLVDLNCNRNKLEYLNLKNGKNNLLIEPDFKNNPKLTCIVVDNASYSNINWADSKENIASYNEVTCSVLIPDSYFEDKLIQLGIDKDGKNGQVAISSVLGVTSLNVASSLISDLTGIQSFKDLNVLNCSSNIMTTIDLSKNTNLTELLIPSNKLTALDLSKNTALTKLTCYSNSFTNLDFSSNTALTTLSCDRNKLTSLNVSKNKALTYLDCSQNQLATLDVGQNTALINLNCSTNQLTNLDISKNITLTWFLCNYNKIATLDVSGNLELKQLSCTDNKLKSLDASKNTALTIFECSTNNLEYVNAKNGNNNKIIRASFGYNPNLFCILVDNAAVATANYITWKKDKEATYSDTFCDTGFTLIPDSNFEDKLIEYEIDTDGKNGKVLTKSIASISQLFIISSSISDLTGIEDFKSLEVLNCEDNKLTTLDVSKNLLLASLYCGKNQLTNLDLSKNTLLNELICGNNQLTNLDLSANTAMNVLRCDHNQLKNLDFTKNKELGTLYCNANQLESLNLKNGNNTALYDTNFTLNPNLTCILVDNASFASYNWKSKDNIAVYSTTPCQAVYTLIPDSNFEKKLIDLGIDTDGVNGKVLTSSINTVTSLNVSSGSISDLTGIQSFINLESLNCSSNKFSTVDLSKNTKLTSLVINTNFGLNQLDLTANTALISLDCNSGYISSLDLSKNKALTFINCSSNNLVSLNLKNGNNKNLNLNSTFVKNSNLTCIIVDDEIYANQKWLDLKDSTASYTLDCINYTLIPDSNFEQKLISLGIDTDGLNGKIVTSNISKVTYLDLSNSNITNLTGIEKFTALTYLDCNFNKISTIDVSKNKLLTKLSLHDNQLTSLDVSSNKDLYNLTFSLNQIKTIDLSQNKNLHIIAADRNLLSSINLSANPAIEILFCGSNNLTTIDVSNLPNLIALECSLNNIAELNVSNNSKLEDLYCYNNQIKALDLKNNPELLHLSASSNQLTSLDLSNNKKLTLAHVIFNPLTYLNIQNGNNENFVVASNTGKKADSGLYTTFLGLTSLSCIQVDNVAYSNANWSQIKESTTTYSNTCKTLGVDDSVFAKATIYPNPTNGEVNIDNIILDKANVYNELGQLVKTFTLDSNNTNNTINLSGLSKGVYYIYLINQDAASAKKIIIK
ncbi:leucine-rich repeat domain-containing protein [Flavobacterium sp. N1736]|uniref:leucine-rich repeat domain-containing protein n=1 Tax=Flavobacterium sp. N1736 TaxID=2986823 RepID=UPI002223FBFE|nr:leucine-rich repeat domain-containing protein [Flavobacterium sp. N1736]